MTEQNPPVPFSLDTLFRKCLEITLCDVTKLMDFLKPAQPPDKCLLHVIFPTPLVLHVLFFFFLGFKIVWKVFKHDAKMEQ